MQQRSEAEGDGCTGQVAGHRLAKHTGQDVRPTAAEEGGPGDEHDARAGTAITIAQARVFAVAWCQVIIDVPRP